ncbi:hypothetical protein BH10CYA1_BH10CYA1_03880 [soil metagenome]
MMSESGSSSRFCLESQWTGVPLKGPKSKHERSQNRSQGTTGGQIILRHRAVNLPRLYRDPACHVAPASPELPRLKQYDIESRKRLR